MGHFRLLALILLSVVLLILAFGLMVKAMLGLLWLSALFVFMLLLDWRGRNEYYFRKWTGLQPPIKSRGLPGFIFGALFLILISLLKLLLN